jgi:deazaflavin-dependent oxidoreductase (nitroreductase family)
MARFNRVGANRLQRLWAPYIPPYALVVHRGRKSGRTYRTPVTAFVRHGVMAVALPYGVDSDWVQNLLAEGGGELVRAGRTRRISNPRIVPRGQGSAVPRVARFARNALLAELG